MIQLIYNKKNIDITNKILDNKNFILYYSKFLIRYGFDNKTLILDDSFEISLCPTKIILQTIGSSLAVNKFLYRHKLYKNLKFYWFNPQKNLNQTLINNSSLLNVSSKNYVLFSKIIKGGLQCYSRGVSGLLPKSQLKNIVKLQKIDLSILNSRYFINLKNKSKYFFFRAPTNYLKITYYPFNVNKFNKHGLKIKIHQPKSMFNVFFCHSDYNYENKQKINKKIREQNSRKKNSKF